MVNIVIYVSVGLISGWIGFLLSRNDKNNTVDPYLVVGILGGIIGSITAKEAGMSGEFFAADPISIFNALFMSALFVVGYIIITIMSEKNKAS